MVDARTSTPHSLLVPLYDKQTFFSRRTHSFLSLVLPLVSPEKQRHCPGTSMASNSCTNGIDFYLSLKIREFLLHQRGDCPCIFQTCGMADIALPAVFETLPPLM